MLWNTLKVSLCIIYIQLNKHSSEPHWSKMNKSHIWYGSKANTSFVLPPLLENQFFLFLFLNLYDMKSCQLNPMSHFGMYNNSVMIFKPDVSLVHFQLHSIHGSWCTYSTDHPWDFCVNPCIYIYKQVCGYLQMRAISRYWLSFSIAAHLILELTNSARLTAQKVQNLHFILSLVFGTKFTSLY